MREIDKSILSGIKPDPHTVTLKDKGIWYGLFDEGQILSALCIRPQQGELYIGEVFTLPEHRRKGNFRKLLDYVCNTIYPDYSINTHALISSKKVFESCGFVQYSYREFKYGNQWWLRRKGKKL